MLNLLNPNIKIKILICYSLYISYRTSREKLLKYQSNLCDMSIILVTNLCYKTRRNLTLITLRA